MTVLNAVGSEKPATEERDGNAAVGARDLTVKGTEPASHRRAPPPPIRRPAGPRSSPAPSSVASNER